MRQPVKVPQADHRLIFEAVAPLIIAVVADKAGLVIVQETVRAVVDGEPQQRHVIGVHHAVRKAYALPLGDQARGALDDVGKP